MKKIIFILLFVFFSLFSYGDPSDFYYGITGFFTELADPNAGLTSFGTLMIPIGGRLEGMGTAFTAVSDDSSFLESNPAGSATLENTELTFFHHNWIADSAYI